MQTKFLVYSLIGIGLISLVSYFALNIHMQIVKKQASYQTLYSMVSNQFNLVSQISVLSSKFSDELTQKEVKDLEIKFKDLLAKLNTENENFNLWLSEYKFSNFETIEELLVKEKVDKKMLLFMKRARQLVNDEALSPKKTKQNIRFLTDNSRDGLGEVFSFLAAKIEKEQVYSLNTLNKAGVALVVLCILQVLLVWLLVFKPLYSTILVQHQRISDALLNAKSANRSKTDFLANISHEIRTPMTAIMGYADILKRENLAAEEKFDAIKIIDQNASHLLGLIDEILDISKIESGKFNFEMQEVDVSTFLNEVYSLINVKSEDKGIGLIFRNRGEIPKKIMTDPKRLKQILFNILGNAIKFTEVGFVELTLSFNKESSFLVFTVKDTGKGISLENRGKLFRPFEQADTSVARKYGGTGLGLALSRNIARGMGGDVRILDSKVGVGTIFEIFLHVGESHKDELMSSFSTSVVKGKELKFDSNELKNKKILVVDDAKENARLFKMYLMEAGAVVEVAHDGEQALQMARSDYFDIILLDLQMPGKDGFQVLRELRERSFSKPVVALTAHAMKEEKDKTREAGFDYHISKPVKPNDLIRSVATLIDADVSTFRNT